MQQVHCTNSATFHSHATATAEIQHQRLLQQCAIAGIQSLWWTLPAE
jgi:hypothetical protein